MSITNKIVNYLINNDIISTQERNIYEYGTFVFLYNSFLVLNILFLGYLLDQFQFSFLFLLFWTPYRILIGGSHCSTAFKCYFFSIFTF